MNRPAWSAALILAWLWCTGSSPGAKTPPATLSGPVRGAARQEFRQVHMGLPVRVVVYAAGEDLARSASAAAFARIEALERVMSDYRPDSEVRRLEDQAGEWTTVSSPLAGVLQRALTVARASNGAFDPTVGPFVALWRRARTAGQLPTATEIAAARAAVGWWRVELRPARAEAPDVPAAVRLAAPGMRLDLGGIAKGYILQEALGVLRDRGVSRALIEAGGDIVAGDPPPHRSGWLVAAPDSDPCFETHASRLANAALASSGPSFQFVEIDGIRYSHIIDPRSGLGVTRPTVAHVIAEDGATADALATALTILDPVSAGALLARFPDVVASVRAPSSPPLVRREVQREVRTGGH